jgi:iron complex transport system substrate-binding protein
MRKPDEHWETARCIAYRVAVPASAHFADDQRAERFELRFRDGRVGHATLGLRLQLLDEVAATDPDVAYAARAWLAARGQRQLAMHGVGADSAASIEGCPVLAAQPFSVQSLSSSPTKAAPERVITLCPSNTELVDALGCFERVIACDASSDHPPATAQLERLGHDLAPSLDRIVELAPDLVVSSLTVPGMERVVTGLRARGVPQFVLAPSSLSDVMEGATALAHVLGVPERGALLIQKLEEERRELQARAAERPVRRVYLEWWPKPMFTPGRDCYSNELIALAGGVNVFGERTGSSVRIESHDLIAADPEVCFVSWCGVREDKLDCSSIARREGLASLGAVQRGHIYPLNEAFSGRPGPRMLEAARIMARALDANRE